MTQDRVDDQQMRSDSGIAARVFFHGTRLRHAYPIMVQGFKIGEVTCGRASGRGLYIAQRITTAAAFSGYEQIIIQCRVLPGTKVLWCYEDYDPRMIDSLKREFGRELLDLGPAFGKAIPRNKHLTKQELVHLCNYFFAKRTQLARPNNSKQWIQRQQWWYRLSHLTTQVRRHGFNGLGDRSFWHWDSDEIMLFNPSRARPLSAHRCIVSDWDHEHNPLSVQLSDPIPLSTLKQLSQQAQREWDAL